MALPCELRLCRLIYFGLNLGGQRLRITVAVDGLCPGCSEDAELRPGCHRHGGRHYSGRSICSSNTAVAEGRSLHAYSHRFAATGSVHVCEFPVSRTSVSTAGSWSAPSMPGYVATLGATPSR